MIYLPDLTLVIIDTVSPDLARAALLDTLNQICPQSILTFTAERLLPGNMPNCEWLKTKANSYTDVAECLWHEVPWYVKTSHYLVIQWDGWVLDGSLWNNQWLDYDYIGAPWEWHKDGLNVGNGGFSLRSRALGRFVGETRSYVPKHPEDDTLCREYRRDLESKGFTWASEATAARFSFERAPATKTFGFHGAFNWPRILTRDQLASRIAIASDYAKSKSEWQEMLAVV
jgi:hypothetical protein